MTSAEARDLANKQNARGWVFDIVDALAALESFCEGLKGVNDDLRGKLAAAEKMLASNEGRVKEIVDEHLLARAEAAELALEYCNGECKTAMEKAISAEEDVRILTEASRANEDMIERARGSVPVERLEALANQIEEEAPAWAVIVRTLRRLIAESREG